MKSDFKGFDKTSCVILLKRTNNRNPKVSIKLEKLEKISTKTETFAKTE